MTKKQAAEKALKEETARKNKAIQEQKRLANIQKGIALTSAIINTAVAVTNAIRTQPFLLGLILAGTAAATGAVEIATIASQQFAEGTEFLPLNGNKPGRDTVPAFVPSSGEFFMLDGGERIIDKKTNSKMQGISNSLLPLAVNDFLAPKHNLLLKSNFNNFANNKDIVDAINHQTTYTKKIANKEDIIYRNGKKYIVVRGRNIDNYG